MRWALIIIRLGLTVMFVLSGVAKLADRAGSRRAVADFGIPPRLTRPVGLTLPIVELLLAGGLLVDRSSRVAAAGSTLLLAVFIGAISRVLGQGRTFDCHCFGGARSSPIGPRTIVRNGIVAALAIYVALSPVAHLL